MYIIRFKNNDRYVKKVDYRGCYFTERVNIEFCEKVEDAMRFNKQEFEDFVEFNKNMETFYTVYKVKD